MSTESTGDLLLNAARDAATHGSWQQAYDLFVEADSKSALTRTDLGTLAGVAYACGHFDITITAWERAFRQSMEANDRLGAAAAAVQIALHLLLDTALMAPVRGWLRRAEQLLDDQTETPVHAWIAVVRNYERMFSGDLESAHQWAQRAVELGNKIEPAAAAIGRIAEARTLILKGEVNDGLRQLEEAGTSLLSGEINPLAVGVVFCEMVCGLQGLAQYDLAEQWTEAMDRWHQGQPVGSVHGRCLVHRAEILRMRGHYAEAELDVLRAFDELKPYLRRELGWPLTELGRIRLRMGDLDGAEDAFLEAEALGWDPQPGLALLYLARSNGALAVTTIRNALDNPRTVPSKEFPPSTQLRRAPLLQAQVEIEVQAGDLIRAEEASKELTLIAEQFGSSALRASAAQARGRVLLAEGKGQLACGELEAALELWTEVGAPYEAALSRLWLGYAYEQNGQGDLSRLSFQSARLVFERLGAKLETEQAARMASQSSTQTDGFRSGKVIGALKPVDDAQREAFLQEGEYWSITFQGQTHRLRDLRGLHYLSRLLAEPGREFHVLTLTSLVGSERSAGPSAGLLKQARVPASDAGFGALLDSEAKESYRRRLVEIEEDVEEAEAMGDGERAAQGRAEHDFLVRELARAVGLGARDRKAGTISERARVGVTRAIRQALSKIEALNPALGEHLNRAIRTGTYCAYLPDSRIRGSWNT